MQQKKREHRLNISIYSSVLNNRDNIFLDNTSSKIVFAQSAIEIYHCVDYFDYWGKGTMVTVTSGKRQVMFSF